MRKLIPTPVPINRATLSGALVVRLFPTPQLPAPYQEVAVWFDDGTAFFIISFSLEIRTTETKSTPASA